MPKKLPVPLVSVLAVAVLALSPAAAQGAPHYYVNGAKVKEGTANTKTFIGWGTPVFKETKGGFCCQSVTCHYVEAGTLFNPIGGYGEGLVQAFASFDCEQELDCPADTTGLKVTPDRLPWRNLLTEEVVGTIRQETTGIRLLFECFKGEEKLASFPLVNPATQQGLRPRVSPGSSALHPGSLEYEYPASGELELEGSGGTIGDYPAGVIKTLGYNGQELIGAANP